MASFQKLRAVLDALDAAAATVVDPTQTWKKCKFDVVEEFCKRIPDATVVSNVGTGKTETSGVLQTEAKTRLLAYYYTTIPEMALSGKFDINVALSNFLSEDVSADQKGMKLLEMGHLLNIANEVPDVKWWNKTPTMTHSPFVSILKLCCDAASNSPQQQVRALLHSFASTSYLFQAETTASPLDALLESLAKIGSAADLEAVLTLLDEVVARCIRGPFKYLDDYAEIAAEVTKTAPAAAALPPVSPLILTLVEQWKFFAQAKDHSAQQKAAGVQWLLRFLESAALAGENRYVLAVLCERLSTAKKDGFALLKAHLEKDGNLAGVAFEGASADAGIRDLFTRIETRSLDVSIVAGLVEAVKARKIEVSIFDLAVVQKAIVAVTKSKKVSAADARKAIAQLNELMKFTAFQLIGQGDKFAEKTKKYVVAEGACLELFLNTAVSVDKIPAVVELSQGM